MIEFKESEFAPYFNTGQIKVLRDLLQKTYTQAIADVSLSLNDLTDVDIISEVNADVLTYDGTDWVNYPIFTQVTTTALTSYTLSQNDANSFLVTTSNSAVTITIPAQEDESFGDFVQVEIMQGGDGKITVSGASGVTVRVDNFLNPTTSNKYAVVGLKRVAEDEWVVFGNLEA